MAEDWRAGGFGLYVHWPFCEAKCPYCDFNSHVVQGVDQDRWAAALAREVGRVAETTKGRVLGSIFFGGGTPSLMLPETVARVLDAARQSWIWANDIEITLEANPRSVEAGRFRAHAAAGVNRVSLGVQALRDADLKRLGRLHDVREARAALDVARDVFSRVSADLIYARQDQSLTDWEAELQAFLDLGLDHLSLYQLTLEPGTAFWDRAQAGGLRGLPEEDLAADLFELTQEMCDAAGYRAYEVSNHARDGAESRHNLVYWRYGDWAGIGPGAHGRLTQDGLRHATEAWSMPMRWLEAAEAGSGDRRLERLTARDMAGEYLMMGLRLTEGIEVARARGLCDAALPERDLEDLLDFGLIWQADGRIGTTPRGRLMLNRVVARLMPGD